MANIVEKIMDVISPHRHDDDSAATTTPSHSSGVGNSSLTTDPIHSGTQNVGNTAGSATRTDGPHASNIANKLDPTVDSNASHYPSTNTYGSNSAVAPTTSGPHSSSLANKIDPTVDSNASHYPLTNTYGSNNSVVPTTSGPQSSSLANKIDSIVDSNKIHHPSANTYGSNSAVAPTTSGPHSSSLANKIDPTVDSDRDGSRTLGNAGTGAGVGSGVVGDTYGHTSSTHGHHSTHGPHSSNLANKFDPSVNSSNPAPHTYGPHSSDLANKLDPRVDSDGDGKAGVGPAAGVAGGTHGAHSTHGLHSSTSSSNPAPHTYGPHSSDLANKLDPKVDSDGDGKAGVGPAARAAGGTYSAHSTHGAYLSTLSSNPAPHTYGPHSSDLANKLDPKVDSDGDGKAGVGPAAAAALGGTRGTHSTHDTHSTHGSHSNHGLYSSTSSSNPALNTYGPHSSDLVNKLDTKVDSDGDGKAGVGPAAAGVVGSKYATSSGTHGPHSTSIGTKFDPTVASSNPAPHTYGPHSSDLANKLDPKVDSDGDGEAGVGSAAAGLAGNQFGTTTDAYGPHKSKLANKLDPTVDSNKDGSYKLDTASSTTGTGTHTSAYGTPATHAFQTPSLSGPGTGPAPNTYGPHKLDILNKLDPRVDSDLDGSKTIGNNKFATTDEFGPGAGATAGAGSGLTGYHPDTTSSTYGSHSTKLGNKLNPTVGGTAPSTHTTGPHSSSIANKLDPRVVANPDGTYQLGTQGTHAPTTGAGTHTHDRTYHTTADSQTYDATSGTGHSTTTPHSSSLLNKLDPRVDNSATTAKTSQTTDSTNI